MSTFDVLNRYGTAALLRFVGAVALFVALHLLRLPLLLAARGVEALMRRLDAYATRQTTPTQPPFANHREVHDVFA